jgi:hypothetical protein
MTVRLYGSRPSSTRKAAADEPERRLLVDNDGVALHRAALDVSEEQERIGAPRGL